MQQNRGQNVHPFAAIRQAFAISRQHFKVGQAPMCKEDRLCTLQMGVTWEDGAEMCLSQIQQSCLS